jgi:hypothetical protein
MRKQHAIVSMHRSVELERVKRKDRCDCSDGANKLNKNTISFCCGQSTKVLMKKLASDEFVFGYPVHHSKEYHCQ